MTRNEKKNDVPNAFFFFCSTQSLLVKLMVRTVPSLWFSRQSGSRIKPFIIQQEMVSKLLHYFVPQICGIGQDPQKGAEGAGRSSCPATFSNLPPVLANHRGLIDWTPIYK